MTRREHLLATGALLVLAAVPSFAQTPNPPRRIAYLFRGAETGSRRSLQIVRNAMKKLGYIEGRDFSFDVRWADGSIERLIPLAVELVASNPAVLITATSEAVAACKQATSSIPIVFAAAAFVVEQGFVTSLRRPGGNITGVALHQLDAKMVELIRDTLPAARRLAVLIDEKDRFRQVVLNGFERAAKRFKFEPVVMRVVRAEDFEGAFKDIAGRKVDALYQPNISLFNTNRERIVELALKARLPHFSTNVQMAAEGALLDYGTSLEENHRRAASLVDKILRGAKPGELPVELPERFELTVNMKTATALRIKIPQAVLLRATKVIE